MIVESADIHGLNLKALSGQIRDLQSTGKPAPAAQVSKAECSHPFRTGTSIEVAQGGGVCSTCGAALAPAITEPAPAMQSIGQDASFNKLLKSHDIESETDRAIIGEFVMRWIARQPAAPGVGARDGATDVATWVKEWLDSHGPYYHKSMDYWMQEILADWNRSGRAN